MPHLRLCRDTDEDQAPAPLPFRGPEGSDAVQSTSAIKDAEDALSRAQSALNDLSDLVDEDERSAEPFALTDWLPDDDGPSAA